MKVLFLSVSGILNSSVQLCHYGPDYLDKDMVGLLNEIIKYTKAKIVLALHSKSKSIKQNLLDHDFPIQDCILGSAIQKWLKKNPEVKNYAILDDEIDYFDVNQFKTDPEIGLTLETAKKIIKHLGREK